VFAFDITWNKILKNITFLISSRKMKKQSFSALLLATSLLATGYVSSCKDNDSDLFTDLDRELSEQASLSAALQSQLDALQTKIQELEAKKECVCQISESWKNTLASGSFDDSLKDSWQRLYGGVYATQSGLDQALSEAQAARELATRLLTQSSVNADSLVILDAKIAAANANISEAISKANAASELAQSALNTANTANTTAEAALALAQETKEALANLSIPTATPDLSGVHDSLVTIYNYVDVINSQISNLGTVTANAADALAKATANEAEIAALQGKVAGFDKALADSVAILRAEAQANYNQAVIVAQTAVEGLRADLTQSIANLKSELEPRIAANETAIATLTTAVAANAAKLTTLESTVNGVKADLAKLITGILIQGTQDPVFGYLALPLGVQTNILASYYGRAQGSDLYFPTIRAARYIDADQALTEAEANLIGLQETTIAEAGEVLIGGTGNAGKIYLTINPTNIDFTGQELVLETSAGRASKIKLTNLKHSTTELSFGYSRAASNGFYEADATLLGDDAEEATPNIDLASFKSVAKDLLNNGTSFNLTNFVTTFYNNINAFLPRYGAKASWTNSDGDTVSVLSQYDLATTALRPLSYNFLKDGVSISALNKRLPLIDEHLIDNLVDKMTNDIKINIAFDAISINVPEIPELKLEINWKDIEFTASGDIQVTFNYEVPNYKGQYNEETGEVELIQLGTTPQTGSTTIKGEQFSGLFENIQDEVNKSMAKVVEEINSFTGQISDFTGQIKSVITQISGLQDQINNMLSGLNTQLDSQVQSLIDGIKNSLKGTTSGYIQTVNSYISKVNSVLNRLTSAINNVNSKLQPTMLYTAGDGTTYQVSAARLLPSQVKVSGSGVQGIELNLTSYTAELLAPAFKKYVAVTNVYNGDKNAQAGDADCIAAAKLANNSEYFFNSVLEGSQHSVVFTTDAKYAGYTYEIAYAAVDYSGMIAIRRYYVHVAQ
jgi:hypothetical protein